MRTIPSPHPCGLRDDHGHGHGPYRHHGPYRIHRVRVQCRPCCFMPGREELLSETKGGEESVSKPVIQPSVVPSIPSCHSCGPKPSNTSPRHHQHPALHNRNIKNGTHVLRKGGGASSSSCALSNQFRSPATAKWPRAWENPGRLPEHLWHTHFASGRATELVNNDERLSRRKHMQQSDS